MPSSIFVVLHFADVNDAYKCVKNVNSKPYCKVVKCFNDGGHFSHGVVVKVTHLVPLAFDIYDIEIMTECIGEHKYFWRLGACTDAEIISTFNVFKV